MPTKKQRPAPSLRARLLGDRLRALREDRGLTLKYVSGYLGVDFVDVKDIEHGTRSAHHAQIVALLDLYSVYEQGERHFAIGLARDAFRLSAWEGDFDAPELPVSTLDSLWLESLAQRIRSYGAILVPDLLRTSGYAEEVVPRECGPQASESEVVWRTRALERRQREAFDRRPAVTVQAVIPEVTLLRPVWRADAVWRTQLDHLAKAGDSVRVLPTRAGYLPGMDGSFTVFDLPQKYVPTVACSAYLGGVAVHEGDAGQWYADAFDRLWDAALPPAESAQLITDLSHQ
ncbi:hypothetical protein Psuf_061890 [Phytohabitans suffuscus]|uniref:HTH cro/C1-type domain-containing protein n=1 Tax=Phytohabitans suffuscus TaxID=624315 RepID=A0A6F8YS41_9ACTN|nr:Scr1 family TA system antitoxin-like transcriptional regulator [Phytohabitans suffuscus]BCB88876.1 hypothetical protein Psuf_061890 [Phytohabitans suffuscus]